MSDDSNNGFEKVDPDFHDESSSLKRPIQIAGDLLEFGEGDGSVSEAKEVTETKQEDEGQVEKKPSSSSACCCSFDCAKLSPRVKDLVLWANLKKSGIVFTCTFVLLLSLSLFSLISVIAYFGIAILGVSMALKGYQHTLQAIQKTPETATFKFLPEKIEVDKEKVQKVVDIIVSHLNEALSRAKALFLVENFVDSLKFALFLWALTYIGSWFNLLTLVTWLFVGVFSVPKIYMTYRTEIDHYFAIAKDKVMEQAQIIKEKMPDVKLPFSKAKTQ